MSFALKSADYKTLKMLCVWHWLYNRLMPIHFKCYSFILWRWLCASENRRTVQSNIFPCAVSNIWIQWLAFPGGWRDRLPLGGAALRSNTGDSKNHPNVMSLRCHWKSALVTIYLYFIDNCSNNSTITILLIVDVVYSLIQIIIYFKLNALR